MIPLPRDFLFALFSMNTPKITFHSVDTAFTLKDQRKIKNWIENLIASQQKITGEISYVFCSDEYLLSVNKEHLNHDYYTDIITFDYCENKLISGDLFISIDRIKENAKQYNTSNKNELHRVMAHGVLHLLGFKDKTVKDAKKMREMEDYSLNLRTF